MRQPQIEGLLIEGRIADSLRREQSDHFLPGRVIQIEELSGKTVTDTERELIMHGAEEIDLVHSDLEETMINATREIMDIWLNNPSIPDMRTAAYVSAINKVAITYVELGIFP